MRVYLKQLRQEKSMTQAELAKKIGISQNYYASLENGVRGARISVELVLKIASALNISPIMLLEYERDNRKNR